MLADPAFLEEWTALVDACPWSTVFQRPAFVTAVYDVYRDRREPFLVLGRRSDGSLAGLLPLAQPMGTRALWCAGAPLAEYTTWLATPDASDAFIGAAIDELRRTTSAPLLRFLCLAPGTPTEWCTQASRAVLRPHERPLLAVADPSGPQASLKKKSNKSKVSRLRRVGEVRLVQLEDRDALEDHLDSIMAEYDLRQGATYGVTPFKSDPAMRELYRRLADEPGCLHTSVLLAGDEMAAGHIGFVNGNQVLLGVIAHRSSLAAASPGKLILLFLGKLLGEQGYDDLDLTIGGDYKWRFATHSDSVYVLEIYLSKPAYWRYRIRSGAVGAFRSVVKLAGLDEERLRKRSATLLNGVRRLPGGSVARSGGETVVYFASSPPDVEAPPGAERIRTDDIGALRLHSTEDESATPVEFFDRTLRRLGQGATPYTVVEDGRLVYSGWTGPASCAGTIDGSELVEIPSDATLLFGDCLGTGPDAQALMELALRTRLAKLEPDLEGPVLAFLDSKAQGAVAALRELGFRPVGTIRGRRRLGRIERHFEASTEAP